MESNYQSIGGYSAALEKDAKRKKRSRLLVIIGVAVLIILIAVGVTVGVVVSKNNSKEKSSSTTTGASTGGTTKGGNSTSTTSSDPNDPSNFTKDARFHKAFYGMAYTPEGSLPDYGCSISLPSVIEDMQLMSQLTSRVRLYGADCNQTAMVLEAIKQTKIDMEVFVGNFVVAGDPGAYERQRDVIKDAISTYGTDHIGGVTVGNEFMLNWVTEHGTQDVNSAIGNEGAAILKANIDDTRKMLAGMSLSKNLPVGNSDAGSYFNTDIMTSIDYGMSNVHAWFANQTAEAASAWVNQFFNETNVQVAAALPNKPKMYIAETGWPTASSDAGNANNGASPASIAGLQTFLDTFVCQANTNGVPYFFFEFKDEEWKDKKYGGVEGHWGLFDTKKQFKDLKLPTCDSP